MTREENLAARRALVTDYMHRAQSELGLHIDLIDGVDVDSGQIFMKDQSRVSVDWPTWTWTPES